MVKEGKGRVSFRLATTDDDSELRHLLRTSPMPGAVSLTLEREPNFFDGASIEGDFHQTIVARDQNGEGEALGLASRSIRAAWVNGERFRLGYIGQLRIRPTDRRRARLLIGGFDTLRHLHEDGQAPLYITTIVSDNREAIRLLEADWRGKPKYRRFGTLRTLAIPTVTPLIRQVSGRVTIHQAGAQEMEVVANFLQAHLSKFQFAPFWEANDLTDSLLTRGLKPQDFFLAKREGKVVGCVALWNQQSFKQTVIHDVQGLLKWALPLVNGTSRWFGWWPKLPSPGESLPYAFISHLAVEHDDPIVHLELMYVALNHAFKAGHDYVLIGLDDRHPLLATTIAAFPHREYRSNLYIVYWSDGEKIATILDKTRIPGVELAVL